MIEYSDVDTFTDDRGFVNHVFDEGHTPSVALEDDSVYVYIKDGTGQVHVFVFASCDIRRF